MNYEEVLQLISTGQGLNFEASFAVSKVCSALLREESSEGKARDLIIRVLDIYDNIDEKTKPIWNDLAEAAGLHPYVDPGLLSGSALLRHEFYKSPYLRDFTLHEGQFDVSIALHASKSVVVSAPTSFGKSLLIEEIVASGKYNNIVIIQPTLALIDETRKKLQKYRSKYNIIVSTSQKPVLGSNLFIFTGERVVEYKDFPPIDFFVLDEFYKLSLARDDERAATLNLAVYKLLEMTKKFYMLGPNIKDISQNFKEKYNVEWVKTNFATVAVNLSDLSSIYRKKDEKVTLKYLFELLNSFEEPTLVYCSSPDRVNRFSALYSKFNGDSQLSSDEYPNRDLIEWIDNNIHDHWNLVECLRKGIGVHHGALPRHITSSIVDAFNKGSIKYLFCTATLIEGVNTSAKNVILFDKKKGLKTIDYFDFKNIVGRSGRMKRHYIGNVYQFHPQPLRDDLFVDIPLTDQDNASLELLVHVKPQDLTSNSKDKLNEFNRLDQAIREVIKKNIGVPVEGQLKLIQELEGNLYLYHPLLAWSTRPSYEELKCVIELGWRFLLKSGESKGGVRTPAQLTVLTLKYIKSKTLKELINEQVNSNFYIKLFPDYTDRVQGVVHSMLQIKRHWFDYKLPKIISVVSEIQALVYGTRGLRQGNYLYLAGLLENNLLPQDLTILLEYDIPASAIDKIKQHLGNAKNEEQLLARLSTLELDDLDLLEYEKQKIKALLS